MSEEGGRKISRIPLTDKYVMTEVQLDTRLERARNGGKLEFVRELFCGTEKNKDDLKSLLNNYILVREHVKRKAVFEKRGEIPEEYGGWAVVKSIFEQIERRLGLLGIKFIGEIGEDVTFTYGKHYSQEDFGFGESAKIQIPGISYLGVTVVMPRVGHKISSVVID